MNESINQTVANGGNIFQNIDIPLVQKIGEYLGGLENTIKTGFTENGMDGFHVLFLLCLVLVGLVFIQSYITKGQNSIMGYAFLFVMIFIILSMTGVI